MAKRPCLDLDDPAIVQVLTTLEKEDEFQFLWKAEHYSYFSKLRETRSETFQGGPKTNNSWQLKLDTNIVMVNYKERIDYDDGSFIAGFPKKGTAVNLLLTGFGDLNDEDEREINVQVDIKILDANNLPVWEEVVRDHYIRFKDISEKGVRILLLESDTISAYLFDDTLKIHCTIATFKGLENPELASDFSPTKVVLGEE